MPRRFGMPRIDGSASARPPRRASYVVRACRAGATAALPHAQLISIGCRPAPTGCRTPRRARRRRGGRRRPGTGGAGARRLGGSRAAASGGACKSAAGGAARRELQRQSGLDARRCCGAGADQPAAAAARLWLGDMRELGEGAAAYHAGLADAVAASGRRRSSYAARTCRRLSPAAVALGRAPAGLGARCRKLRRRCARGDVVAVEGLVGLENEDRRRCHRRGERRRGGTLRCSVISSNRWRSLRAVQPLPLHHLPLDRGASTALPRAS